MNSLEWNLIFIGDNLSVMKSDVFQQKVAHVDMIYIDPPYNTGSKFSYSDKKNSDERIHFMEKRLLVAKEILKKSWVIFISIDDNEYATLKILCDQIFDKRNSIWTFITFQSQRSNAKFINTVHEYVLCYAKDKECLQEFKIKRIQIPEDYKMIEFLTNEIRDTFSKFWLQPASNKLNLLIKKFCDEKNITWLRNYSNIDENWEIFFGKDLSTPWTPREVNIPEIHLHLDPLPTRWWSSDKKFLELYKNNLLCFKNWRPYEKHFLKDAEDNVTSLLNFYSRQWSNDLNKLWLRDLFDTPKPVELIKFLIRISTQKDATILDFFAGSWTTAQAIYELNQEDCWKRKYVLIQLDEEIRENTKAFSFCKEHNIDPYVSELLLYRINTFLTLSWSSDPSLSIIK